MTEIPIFKRTLVEKLWLDIGKNIECYISGDLSPVLQAQECANQISSVNSTELDEENLKFLNAEPSGMSDATNATLIYQSLKGMHPHLAADERVWVALTHQKYAKFSFERYGKNYKSVDDAVKLVRTHFFGRVGGIRGLHRNNALSCLWWYAYVLSKNENHSLEELNKTILSKTDFRAQLFERPTTVRVNPVRNAITDIVIEETKNDPNPKLMKREVYREWFRRINLNGGTRLYASMSDRNVKSLFRELIP